MHPSVGDTSERLETWNRRHGLQAARRDAVAQRSPGQLSLSGHLSAVLAAYRYSRKGEPSESAQFQGLLKFLNCLLPARWSVSSSFRPMVLSFLVLRPFNPVTVTPTIKLFSLVFYNCSFVTVLSHNVNI